MCIWKGEEMRVWDKEKEGEGERNREIEKKIEE